MHWLLKSRCSFLSSPVDHFQFTLIHGPNAGFPSISYEILFFTASHFTFATRHIYIWASFLLWLSLFILSEVFLYSSPVAYWTPTYLGEGWGVQQNGCSFSAVSFCLSILNMGFFRQECWSGLPFPSPVAHLLSELCTISAHLECPYMTWLIVSLNYTRLWSMWSFWLVFCDYDFHFVCPLMGEYKRLV